MNTLTLQRNVQFIYEEQLARIEMQAFGCEDLQRDPDNPWQFKVRLNGTDTDVLKRAAYIGTLDSIPTVYDQLIKPKYQGGEFNRTRSVNQYLTHWIYPYRGKFHPQMIRALLNIVGVTENSLVLDPYVGSGTTALEASLLGAKCIGVDISPLCVLLTRVKSLSVTAVDLLRPKVHGLLEVDSLDPLDASTANDASPIVADFVQMARMVTFSDMSRRKRDGRVSFRKNLQAMLESVEAHASALDRFEITAGDVSAVLGDCRNLGMAGVGEATIDAVVTSPPYSIALDYVKNDIHALKALEVDLVQIRNLMTGVRGRGRKEKLAKYNKDLKRMFREVERVLKPGAKAVFVIGDATVGGREYTTTRQMGEWAVEAGLERESELAKTVFGLYNVMRDEKILIFRKPATLK